MFKRNKNVENPQEAMHVRHKSTIAALNELMRDSALSRHRKTLDDVAKIITGSIENDKKWSTKCQKLLTELSACELKVKTAMQLSEEDKNVIDTLKGELQCAWETIEGIKSVKDKYSLEDEDSKHAGDNEIYRWTEEKFSLLDEIEKGKLQVFELEEELANKEKTIEELNCFISLKMSDSGEENLKSKKALEKGKESKDAKRNRVTFSTRINPKTVLVPCQTLNTLKKQLQDLNKRDQLSVEKLKHLMKKNKMLNRQLQKARNQASLLRVQLIGQTKMLDLLSCQCCRLEENDKKQSRVIGELEKLRDKHVDLVGKLQQELHETKKKELKILCT